MTKTIEQLAQEAEAPADLDSPAWRFVNTELFAALVAEECAGLAADSDEIVAGDIRAAFQPPRSASK